MATNDDLSEQLAITQKLVAVVEKLAASVDDIEKSYETQVTTVKKLAQVFEQINTGSAVESINSVASSMKAMSDRFDKSGGMTKKVLDEMAKRVGTTGDAFSKGFPKKVTVAAAALSGFAQGVRNLVALTKGIGGFMSTFVEGAFDIAAAIVAIPFKVFSGLIDLAGRSAAGMSELMQAIENLRKEMGNLKGPGAGAVLKASTTLKGFSDTGLSAWRVFGTLAERIEYFTKVATTMGSTFSVLKKEFIENGGALAAFQKGLGLSDDQMKALGDRAITLGKPMAKVFLEMTKQTLRLGDAFDLDQKLIGKDMAKALQDVKHFGQLTVKEIGQASVYARKLGIELDKIVGTLDAFETFDQAAENAAKLSQSFGVTVDAFQLMEAQNPAEQLDMLRKQFKAAGVDSSQFNRQQLKLLSTTTGLDEATAKQAFSMQNQGISLDEIKKKSETAEKKTLTQAQAMKGLADSIERVVKVGEAFKGYFDAFIAGIVRGLQTTPEFRTVMVEIWQGMQQVLMIGFQLGRLLPKLVPGLGQLLSGLRDFFEPKKFTKLFTGVSDAIKDFLSNDKATLPEFMDNMKKKFFDFFDSEENGGRKILSAAKIMFVKFSGLVGQGIQWASDKFAGGIKSLAEFINNPTAFLEKAKASSNNATGFIANALTPIKNALEHAWTVLLPAFKDLFKVLMHKVVEFVKSDEFQSAVKPLYPVIAAVLFGPAFGRAVITALTTSLVKSTFSALSGGGIKKALSSLFESAAPEAGSGLAKAFKIGGLVTAILGASVGVSDAVGKFKSKIVGDFSNAEKEIGAGAAGLADALTFGLLPDELGQKLADAGARVAVLAKQSLNRLLGGLGNDIVRLMSDNFQVLQGLGDVITGIFSGNVDKISDGIVGFARGVLGQFFQLFVTLPPKMFLMITKFGTELYVMFLGVMSSFVEKFGQVIGVDWIANLGKTLKDFFGGALGPIGAAFDKVGSWISDKFGWLHDKIVGTSTKSTEEAKKAAEKVAEAPVALAAIKMPESSAASSQALDSASKMFASYTNFSESTAAAANAIKKQSVSSAVDSVKSMVAVANQLNDALGDGNLNKLDVVAKLDNVARSVGLGAKGTYTVKNKDVVIQLNLNVTMDVDQVERVIIMRKNSLIRERLNFALTSPDSPSTGIIPETLTQGPIPLAPVGTR